VLKKIVYSTVKASNFLMLICGEGEEEYQVAWMLRRVYVVVGRGFSWREQD